MKIVLINKYAIVTGGADRHALELADLLRSRGHDVHFLTFKPPGDFRFSGEHIDALVTHDTREKINRVEAAKAAVSMAWNFEAMAATRRLLDRERPDLVHIHKIYPQFSVAPAVVAAHRRIPIVQDAVDYEFISADPWDETGRKIDTTSPRLTYRVANTASYMLRRRFHVPNVTTWIVTSRFMQRIHARWGIYAEVMPLFVSRMNGVDARGFDERGGIAFVGRLVPAKGVGDVVEVARRHPELSVTIAGSGELEGYLKGEIARLPNLHFLGHLRSDAVNRLLASSRVGLIPSRWAEPAGLVALEAMANGTPVVAYDAGGLTEYVESNRGGMVVEAGDVPGLGEAAARLHGDRDLWSELSDLGKTRVHRYHDPAGYVESLERVYRDSMQIPAHSGA